MKCLCGVHIHCPIHSAGNPPTATEHTPGPWHMQVNRIDRTGDIEFAVFSVVEPDRVNPGMLKWIIGGTAEKCPLSEPDARLIAAAPELLEALKAARDSMRSDYVKREEQGHVHKWKWGERPTLSWVIEQAITKAEGK